MKDSFEISLLESGDLMRAGAEALLANVGRVVAVITVIISALVLFTDIGFADFGAESFTSTLAVMLVASYLMYFSMSDAGESLGESSEEYKSASKKCLALSEKICGERLVDLRDFCKRYSEEELLYRRENLLFGYGYTIKDYEDYKRGSPVGKRSSKIFRKAEKMKAILITPQTLLSKGRAKTKSELQNPEKTKRLTMLLKLIPTTVCMTVTVSVILTAKDGLTLSSVMDGLFKLSSLILIGFKGYSAGYTYTKRTLSLWFDTKARLLESFLTS